MLKMRHSANDGVVPQLNIITQGSEIVLINYTGSTQKLEYDSDQPILWDYEIVTRDPDRQKRKPSSLTP